MSGPVSFATLTTTLPTSDDERGRLLRNVSERDQQLYDYGRSGYRLAVTVTVPVEAVPSFWMSAPPEV